MAGATGLEPATFGVTGRRINQSNQCVFRLLKIRNTLEIWPGLERLYCRLPAGDHAVTAR
jgi:hypothetical protein